MIREGAPRPVIYRGKASGTGRGCHRVLRPKLMRAGCSKASAGSYQSAVNSLDTGAHL